MKSKWDRDPKPIKAKAFPTVPFVQRYCIECKAPLKKIKNCSNRRYSTLKYCPVHKSKIHKYFVFGEVKK